MFASALLAGVFVACAAALVGDAAAAQQSCVSAYETRPGRTASIDVSVTNACSFEITCSGRVTLYDEHDDVLDTIAWGPENVDAASTAEFPIYYDPTFESQLASSEGTSIDCR